MQADTETHDAQYRRLRAAGDPASDIEGQFLDFLYKYGLRLPDHAQYRPNEDVYVQPDFYYEQRHVCVFVDGAAHDQPSAARRSAANHST